MAKYRVLFTQYYSYNVDAEDEQTAIDLAYDEFHSDMCCPIANTCYDDVEIEEIEEDE